MSDVLIFDYDGVLIDSLDIFMKHFLDSCRKYNAYQIKDEVDFLSIFNGNMYENMYKLGLSKEEILRIVLNVKKELIKNQKKIGLFDGIKNVLEKLSKNHILIVVTSNDTEVVKNFFKTKKISVFDEIVGSDKEPSKIKKIEHIKNKYYGNSYLYFGDTKGDIIEGKKAGVKTVAVAWGWHNIEELKKEKPDFVLDKPRDILKIIK